MIRFSKKVEYAFIAMLYMSNKNSGELTTARELSTKFDISLELMCKILQNLVKSNLVISVQGVKGGYFLCHPLKDINISSIIVAIDGPIRLVECIDQNESPSCGREEFCGIKKPIENIQLKFINILNQMTLKDFKEIYKSEKN